MSLQTGRHVPWVLKMSTQAGNRSAAQEYRCPGCLYPSPRPQKYRILKSLQMGRPLGPMRESLGSMRESNVRTPTGRHHIRESQGGLP